MRKLRAIFICIGVTFLVLLFGLFGAAHSYLNSEKCQKKFLSEISNQFRCEVQLEKMQVRILRGADLVNIRVSSNDVRPKNFLKAERLRLRYDFLEALFHQKFILEELKLSTPIIEIDLSKPSNPTNTKPATESNNPTLELASEKIVNVSSDLSDQAIEEAKINIPPSKSPQNSSLSKKSISELRWPAPPSVVLRDLRIEDGALMITLPNRTKINLSDAQILGSISSDSSPNSTGTIRCQTVQLPWSIKLDDTRMNFLWSVDSIHLSKIKTQVLNGFLEGDFKADQTKAEMPFEFRISGKSVGAEELIYAFDPRNIWFRGGKIQGQAQADAKFRGSLLNFQTASGQGQVHFVNVRLIHCPALILLGSFVRRPDFQNLPLQKCEFDFTLEKNKLQIPRIQISSPDIQLTGNGWIHLSDLKQDFQMKLAIEEKLAGWFPPETLEGSRNRPDGFVEIPFYLRGTLKHPQSNLPERFGPILIRAVGGAAIDTIFQAIPTK